MSLNHMNTVNAGAKASNGCVLFHASDAAQTIYTLSAIGVRQAFSIDSQKLPPPKEGACYLPGIPVTGAIDAELCAGRSCPHYSAAEARMLSAIAYLGAGSMMDEYKKEAIAQLQFGQAYRRGLSVSVEFLDTLTATSIQRCASEYTQLALYAASKNSVSRDSSFNDFPLVRLLLAEGSAHADFMLREPFSIDVRQHNTCCPAFMRLEAKGSDAGEQLFESALITLSATHSSVDRFTLSWSPSRATVLVTQKNGAPLSTGALPANTPFRISTDTNELEFTFGTPYLYAMTDLFLPADNTVFAPLIINTYERFTKSIEGHGD